MDLYVTGKEGSADFTFSAYADTYQPDTLHTQACGSTAGFTFVALFNNLLVLQDAANDGKYYSCKYDPSVAGDLSIVELILHPTLASTSFFIPFSYQDINGKLYASVEKGI